MKLSAAAIESADSCAERHDRHHDGVSDDSDNRKLVEVICGQRRRSDHRPERHREIAGATLPDNRHRGRCGFAAKHAEAFAAREPCGKSAHPEHDRNHRRERELKPDVGGRARKRDANHDCGKRQRRDRLARTIDRNGQHVREHHHQCAHGRYVMPRDRRVGAHRNASRRARQPCSHNHGSPVPAAASSRAAPTANIAAATMLKCRPEITSRCAMPVRANVCRSGSPISP